MRYKTEAQDIEEVLDRVRRIETMLHVLCVHVGINPRTREKLSPEQAEKINSCRLDEKEM